MGGRQRTSIFFDVEKEESQNPKSAPREKGKKQQKQQR